MKSQKNSRKRDPNSIYQDGFRAGIRKVMNLFGQGRYKEMFELLRGKRVRNDDKSRH